MRDLRITTHRRDMLKNLSIAATGLFVGGVVGACHDGNTRAQDRDAQDAAVLNFALNLEYLEAEYYLRAIGSQLSAADMGAGAGTVTVKAGGTAVPFTAGGAIEAYAQEIAADELAHVRFLRSALGDGAVPMPNINLQQAFDALALAAGIGPTFDPFASELNFLLGAFIFEDVGVTAYKGAAPLISDKVFLEAAAGILAVEAYHAGIIRTTLFALGRQAGNEALIDSSTRISDLRDTVDDAPSNGSLDKDQPVTADGLATGAGNLVPADTNGIAFSRSPEEVLRIVYGNAARTPNVFFPNGLNGAFR